MSEQQYAEQLMTKAQGYMEQGRYRAAAKLFEQAYRLMPVEPVACSLALVKRRLGEHKAVIDLLKRFTDGNGCLPQARALQSLAHSALGHSQMAKRLSVQAASDLEAGLRSPALRDGRDEFSWLSVGPLVRLALGMAGEHERILDLHRRMPGRSNPEAAFYAGVAAWNTRDFKGAAQLWKAVTVPGFESLTTKYAAVADLVEGGLIPPFTLEYSLPEESDEDELDPSDDASDDDYKPAFDASFMLQLYTVFCTYDLGREHLVWQMVLFRGSWGEALARNLLEAESAPPLLKMAATKGLIVTKKVEPGQQISMVYEIGSKDKYHRGGSLRNRARQCL